MKLEDSIHSNPLVPSRPMTLGEEFSASDARNEREFRIVATVVVVLIVGGYTALWYFSTFGRDAVPDQARFYVDSAYLFGTFAVGLALAYGLWRAVKGLAMWLYGLGSTRQQFWARWLLGVPAVVLSGWAVWVWVVPAAMFLVGQVLTIIGFVAGFLFLMWAIHALQLPAPDTEVVLVEVRGRR